MEKTEKKTAEEILDKHTINRFDEIDKATFVAAMHEFAAQELAEYKSVIEELLPIAEQEIKMSTSVGYSYDKLKAIIERAKKLIKL